MPARCRGLARDFSSSTADPLRAPGYPTAMHRRKPRPRSHPEVAALPDSTFKRRTNGASFGAGNGYSPTYSSAQRVGQRSHHRIEAGPVASTVPTVSCREQKRTHRCAAHGRSRTTHRKRPAPACAAPPAPKRAPPQRPTYRHAMYLLTDESISQMLSVPHPQGADTSLRHAKCRPASQHEVPGR